VFTIAAIGLVTSRHSNAADHGKEVTIGAPLPLPVVVANPLSSPVLTAAIDNPALQPFQFFAAGAPLNFNFQVPTGKTLVIEQVSFLCTQSNMTDFRLFTTSNGTFGSYYFASLIIAPAGVITEVLADQMTHIYADGGSTVTVTGGGAVGTGPHTCNATVGGHLVSAP